MISRLAIKLVIKSVWCWCSVDKITNKTEDISILGAGIYVKWLFYEGTNSIQLKIYSYKNCSLTTGLKWFTK